ncbi:MAG TPA: hypothetical protein VJB10_04010 [Candidatus Peribacteraceae bacterium]|nr:hypothetical protein [Candidatus Peribacteraceae bacterium]
METSVFFAQLLALIYLVTGIGMLADKDRFRALYDEMMKSAPIMYLMGTCSLLLGYLIVSFHNIWVNNWTVLITVIGWIALAKGVVIIVAPNLVLNRARFWLTRMQLAGAVTFVLGLVLGYFGFLA